MLVRCCWLAKTKTHTRYGPTSPAMAEEERRTAPDGGYYTYQEFVDFYGGDDEWYAAPEETQPKDTAWDADQARAKNQAAAALMQEEHNQEANENEDDEEEEEDDDEEDAENDDTGNTEHQPQQEGYYDDTFENFKRRNPQNDSSF